MRPSRKIIISSHNPFTRSKKDKGAGTSSFPAIYTADTVCKCKCTLYSLHSNLQSLSYRPNQGDFRLGDDNPPFESLQSRARGVFWEQNLLAIGKGFSPAPAQDTTVHTLFYLSRKVVLKITHPTKTRSCLGRYQAVNSSINAYTRAILLSSFVYGPKQMHCARGKHVELDLCFLSPSPQAWMGKKCIWIAGVLGTIPAVRGAGVDLLYSTCISP
jgi:hypothetical protein